MTHFSINNESRKKSQWKLENTFNTREMKVQYIKFCSFIYIVPVHFLLWFFWAVLYHSFLNQLQSDFYLLILILLLLKKTEGSTWNYWKDIEEAHRITRIKFQEKETGLASGMTGSIEWNTDESFSLSCCPSLISTYLCIFTSF